MNEYITKATEEKRTFNSGARRNSSEGKHRPDLISPKALSRWGHLMARGAAVHGDRNWEKGIPVSVFQESAWRHLLDYMLGDREEDHLAGVLFNIGGMIHFEGTEWDDINGETIVDEQLYEWIIQAYPEDEQLELQPADENVDLINWDKVAKDAEKNWSQGPGSPWNS